jgi:hypothetical protein
MTKRSRIIIGTATSIVLAVAVVAVAFLLIGMAIEPIDPFPRAQRTVRCANSSSVLLYERKTGWFTNETELSVRFVDPSGRVVRRQGLGTFSNWNDSEMKVLETPEVYCDKIYWTQSFCPRTQPNKSSGRVKSEND